MHTETCCRLCLIDFGTVFDIDTVVGGIGSLLISLSRLVLVAVAIVSSAKTRVLSASKTSEASTVEDMGVIKTFATSDWLGHSAATRSGHNLYMALGSNCGCKSMHSHLTPMYIRTYVRR